MPGSAKDVKPEGLVLLYGVNPNPDVTLDDVKNNVPPKDKLPEVDTLPDNDNPLTLPIPDTFVTVPVLVVNPALLLNILRGIVDICVFLLKVPSTTTISSVPTNVPDALNPLKFKANPIDAELD